MPDLKLNKNDRNIITNKLRKYASTNFEIELSQFDADFFLDFIQECCGPFFFNAGIDTAIDVFKHHSEGIAEEMDLKRII